MASQDTSRSRKSRRKLIVLLAIGSLLLFGVLLSLSSFDLPFINPSTNQQTVFLAALSAVVFLLFVTLTFVLARNLIKLFAERRLGVLGSKFRTRLVDEPLDRQMVFDAGGRCAARYRTDGNLAFKVRSGKCAIGGGLDCILTGDATLVRRT